MQDSVSTRWIRASGPACPWPSPWRIFAFSGSTWMAWMSLAWVVLAVAGSIWLVEPIEQSLGPADDRRLRGRTRPGAGPHAERGARSHCS